MEEEKKELPKGKLEEEKAEKEKEEKEEDWAVIHRERAEFRTKYLHALAESENVRKRVYKEKQEYSTRAIESFLRDWVESFDQFEQAMQFAVKASEEVKNWAIGFQMILTQMSSLLEKWEVRPFASEGKIFDPERHEAMEVVERTDLPPNTITREFKRGYLIKGRVLRLANVQVAQKPQEKKEEISEQGGKEEENAERE